MPTSLKILAEHYYYKINTVNYKYKPTKNIRENKKKNKKNEKKSYDYI